ncbi:MAG: hypothetical protein WCL39_05440 [Armatimonadota bacterium]
MTKMRVALLTAAMVVTVGGAAMAQQTNFRFVNTNGGVGIGTNHGSTTAGGYNGILNYGLPNAFAVKLFCVDLKHNVAIPDSYETLSLLGKVTAPGVSQTTIVDGQYYYIDPVGGTVANPKTYPGAGLASALTSDDYAPVGITSYTDQEAKDRAGAVAWLTDNYINSVVAVQARAQVAIWEIVQDGFGGNFAGGDFSMTNWGTIDTSLMSGIMVEAAAHKTYGGNAQWIQAPRTTSDSVHLQEFAYSPVPEPAFFQFGALLGMSGMGIMKLRRKA